MNARDIVHSFGLFVKKDPVCASSGRIQPPALGALFEKSCRQAKIRLMLLALRIPILDTLVLLQIYK
jgi:hypothetical protein